VYKGDSNAASSSAGNPAEQVLAEEFEADVTVVEVAVDVTKTSTNKPAPQ